MKIAIAAGGLSPERDVSLVSAARIGEALLEKNHEICLFDIYEGPAPGATFGRKTDFRPVIGEYAPDLKKLMAENNCRTDKLGPRVAEICKEADVVFIALHGDIGENGEIQEIFEKAGIAFTGSGSPGSRTAMYKDKSKTVMEKNGILTPKWILLDANERDTGRIRETTGYPCVVKPVSCGSSIGVSIVETEAEAEKACEKAGMYSDRIIVEEKINGREIASAVLGERVLPAIEIIPKEGFYDYKNKYQSGRTEEICPARLTKKQEEDLRVITKKLFVSHGMYGYARGDFIMDEKGAFWCLEINSLPGMTPFSLLPQEAAAAGISYGDLCEEIVNLAIKRKR